MSFRLCAHRTGVGSCVPHPAGVAELADAQVLGACTFNGVRVQVPPPAPGDQTEDLVGNRGGSSPPSRT